MNQKNNFVIVVDWGTSSFRAFLVDKDATILDRQESKEGINNISDNKFESVLLNMVGDWLKAYGPLQVLASGMITSRNGWVEVPYVSCPAGAADIASGIAERILQNGSKIIFIPGLVDQTAYPFPEVMRGEETQIIGSGLSEPNTVVLPGTHSKWVQVTDGMIRRFQTFATGELFSTLRESSFIAGSYSESDDPDWESFDLGIALVANGEKKADALLSLIFSARTGVLFDKLNTNQIRDYLSGLLIASEFVQAEHCGWHRRSSAIGIVGNDALSTRYERCARNFNLDVQQGAPDAATKGALSIADFF